ncbi:hypothetical protein Plec18167_007546 [Paecilomyces lecythidis]|uniref:Yeast cell wall synthesis Kre9/Knh1-like N-terminal domain-containing protein n=1 Tax=Paecilomyces lecythidis TaxID=3004212 RepID=A0ABR3X2V9_9EURO
MRMFLSLLGLCATMASAIQITAPYGNSTVAAGSKTLVQWSSVDTDPSNFGIYLVNFVNWPPSYVPLALDVPTEDGSYSVQIPCDTPASWGYQINAINGTNVYVIYAQSNKFSVSAAQAGCVDSTPVSTCAAPATETVYVTVSPTGSSKNSSTPALAPTASSFSSSSPLRSHYTKPGVVPKTIGWKSGYASPVTLEHPPTPKPSAFSSEGSTGPVTSMSNDIAAAQPTDVEITYVTEWVTVACEEWRY